MAENKQIAAKKAARADGDVRKRTAAVATGLAGVLIALVAIGFGKLAPSKPGGPTVPPSPVVANPTASPAPSTTSSTSTASPPEAASRLNPPEHVRMLAELEQIRLHAGENAFFPSNAMELKRRELLLLNPLSEYGDRVQTPFVLGTLELKMGQEREAIEHLTQAYYTLREPRVSDNAKLAAFWLGVAYLRMAETQNCCARNTPDSCLVPIRGQGVHTQREGSTKAIEYFQKVMEISPPNSITHENARWLYNIAHMTLGNYPHGVPEKYRVPPESLESDEDFPRFMNIASQVGLNSLNAAGGVVADDFNNDGLLDLLVSEMSMDGQLRLWINEGNGEFRETTAEANLTGLLGGLNLVQADYNNDGNLDVLVLRGAWMGPDGCHPNSLLRNNGDGTFTDKSFAAGFGGKHYPTQTASWADVDNDGDLDLYVGHETSYAVAAPCQLFRNNGDETFTEMAAQAGVTNDRYAKAVIFGDYDQDRLPDIYVSNLNGENRLYHNNGDFTFTDVAKQVGVTAPLFSFPAWFWDFDNDGALDLYASSYEITIGHLAMQANGRRPEIMPQRLYKGDGQGGFQDVTASVKLDHVNAPMGANFGDLDNDGYLDFYLATGRPEYWELMPNVMYRNRGGVEFANVTTAGGFGSLQKGHGVTFADLDQDGDQDIFSQLGGAFPGDKYYNALYENPGFGNHFLVVKLVGITSNRSAIGARIHVEISENGKRRSIYRHVNSGGSFGANALQQSIGLGDAERIEKLEIYWPTTGRTQVFDDAPLDQRIQITEDAAAWKTMPLSPFAMGE